MSDPPEYLPSAHTTVDAAPQSGAAEASQVLAAVVVHSPDAAAVGSVRPLGKEPLVIGRDVDGPGLIRDPRMSRVHCRVVFDYRSACHRIGDARSRNGTFVDGHRVESAPLQQGAVIRIGDSVIVVDATERVTRTATTVHRIAPSRLSVLLLGETGTGKELLARAVHQQSGRKGRFVAINCAALPKELLGAELFGHTRGAFSGAAAARAGLFASADGGTLFLDEIGDFPLDLQPVLLRALEENSVRPLGSDTDVAVDVRVVSATHADLELALQERRFRGDLYARLAQATIRIAPLRERRTEILGLVREFAAAAGRDALRITAETAERLVLWDWPFNVREVESLVLAFLAMGDGDEIGIDYLREQHREITSARRSEGAAAFGAKERDGGLERRTHVDELMQKHRGNVSAAAKEIGKPRAQVYRWLRTLGLSPDRYR